MINPFPYSDDNKRYHTLSYHNRKVYGEKVLKAVIDAGFTCPNIDGTKGKGGCIFCDGGSGYFTNSAKSVSGQLDSELERIHRKYPDSKAIAYFQANTNTYAPPDVLKRTFSQVIGREYIVGISIGTRADCLGDDVIGYLCELSKQTNLTVELGLQSVSDITAERINRCYDFETFTNGYNALKACGIRTCVHIINGLPDETEEMMLETAHVLGGMKPDAVKIQLLHIIRNTVAENMYKSGKIRVMSREEYVSTVVKQLEYFPAETVIERITGDGDKAKLIAPKWSEDKIAVLGAIDRLQAERNSFQGKRLSE